MLICVAFTWQMVKTCVIRLLGVEGRNAQDQTVFCAFRLFLVEVQTNAGYIHATHVKCEMTTWRLGLLAALVARNQCTCVSLPSVGAKPLGPLGLNPFIAHSSIISWFSLSVSTSSFCCLAILFASIFVCLVLLLFFVCTAWFFGLLENTFPHLLVATFGKYKN